MYSFDSLLRYWVWFCSKPGSFCGKQSQKSLFSWNIHRIWETRNKQIIEKSNLSQMAVSAMRKKLSVKKLWKCSKREMRIESSQNRVPLLLTGGSDGRESICSAGDLGWILGSGRSPGERNDNSLQDSCLENPMDIGAWWATVHEVAKRYTTEQLTLSLFKIEFLYWVYD